jgi:hypothetical protein
VQAASATYGAAVAALKANNTAKAKAKADLATAETNEPTLVRRVNAQRRRLASAIEVFADGSKDVANSFNVPLDVRTAPPEAVTLVNARPMKSKTGDRAGFRWDPTPGAKGYVLQHARNSGWRRRPKSLRFLRRLVGSLTVEPVKRWVAPASCRV